MHFVPYRRDNKFQHTFCIDAFWTLDLAQGSILIPVSLYDCHANAFQVNIVELWYRVERYLFDNFRKV